MDRKLGETTKLQMRSRIPVIRYWFKVGKGSCWVMLNPVNEELNHSRWHNDRRLCQKGLHPMTGDLRTRFKFPKESLDRTCAKRFEFESARARKHAKKVVGDCGRAVNRR